MRPTIAVLSLGCAPLAFAAPIGIDNPGGEINGGLDGAPISDPAVIGWDSDGGRAINNGTDYGNGGWRLSFEDSESIWQTTGHVITVGDSFSLRFDAAPFLGDAPTGDFTPDLVLVNGALRNGDFDADTSPTDSRSYNDTPEWFNIGGAGNGSQATRYLPANTALDGSRNAVLSTNGTRRFAIDTGHTLVAGEVFQAVYQWRDASNWNDGADRVGVTLFTTSNDSPTGTRTELQTLLSPLSTSNNTYEFARPIFDPIPASAAGKRLFAYFEGVDGNGDNAGFGRLDNFVLHRGTAGQPPAPREIIAELFADDGAGGRQALAGRAFTLKSQNDAQWFHYHLAVPHGALDAHAGKTVGVQFRSTDAGEDRLQSIDNVRLDTWPGGAPDGAFADHWDSTPDQVWLGPGWWANRLHDWEVRDGRANCILGGRDRRTAHRVGTTIRGNGGEFTFSVRTGLHAGTDGGNARSGFLIGSGPNLDWRGALLVHDGLGRDFGLFCGVRSDGTAVIEDYSTNAVTQIAGGATPAAGRPAEARLRLDAIYDAATGEYELSLEVANAAGTPMSTATVRVPSDRVLGSFGLLSHKGTNNARFWFDDFTGTGPALNPEPDRHLAILGAHYTLSRGVMKLNAQLSPLARASTPPVTLEVWEGGAWAEIASAPIDNTDNLSSYTATFRIEDWDGSRDQQFRVRVAIGGTDYHWTGIVRRDPVGKNEIVVAATTCQRISDGQLQSNNYDWSPVRLWQPHTLAFAHMPKHDPDLFLALGDQIYEGQPTPEDSGTDFNRQHDYLYKWYLWVLQAREMTRRMPSIIEPDDHDVFQGNLWGEGGIVGFEQNDGGYQEPASWVKLVDRTQTAHLPDPDPYNPVQPPPPVAQGIGVYFTGMVYGGVGFAVIEDRKFKTGPLDPPADPAQQFLLGDRQKDFLRAWNTDWAGQSIKCVVSQSPFGNLHTHANTGYGFGLNDKDSHGWPLHRRNEVWGILRQSRMFQIAGDQHLALVAHHGIDAPADAGYSFTAPAIANFFPRCWDPAHNTGGRTSTISPYTGDFFFDGVGTLPSGQPNLVAQDPAHVRVLAAANPLEYNNLTRGIDPANLHDRGAGYGIVRIDKTTRRVTFECWPLHADPEFPTTGDQFPDWPITISQTENDGRTPAGYLPVVDTGCETQAVISVYDEADDSLVYAIRSRGNLFRPPVYDLATTYRVEIAFDDSPPNETRTGQAPIPPGAPRINSFIALQPSIVAGGSTTLRWDVDGVTAIGLDGTTNVLPFTVDGIGYYEVAPAADTEFVLLMNGEQGASTQIRVFPDQAAWLAEHFTPAELANASISGDDADPDGDGSSNLEEFQFQSDPRDASSRPAPPVVSIGDQIEFALPFPLGSSACAPLVESSTDLEVWIPLPGGSVVEIDRTHTELSPTGIVRFRLDLPPPDRGSAMFYRARWIE